VTIQPTTSISSHSNDA